MDDCTAKVTLIKPHSAPEEQVPLAVAKGIEFEGDCPLRGNEFRLFDGGVGDVGESEADIPSSTWKNYDSAVTFKGHTATHGGGFPFEVTVPCDVLEMEDGEGKRVTCDQLERELAVR